MPAAQRAAHLLPVLASRLAIVSIHSFKHAGKVGAADGWWVGLSQAADELLQQLGLSFACFAHQATLS